jgi:pimeloyl-ACP methyl ester carboxylesterase
LLFVHGGCHAAWCWDEHFLDFFASRGFRAVAEGLYGESIVIGHSLGGFVVQKYLENNQAPAGVLLASIPPQGVLRSAMRIWLNHPWIAMRANTLGENHEVFTRAPRERLFCEHTPEAIVEVNRSGFDAASFFEKDADYVEALPGRAA